MFNETLQMLGGISAIPVFVLLVVLWPASCNSARAALFSLLCVCASLAYKLGTPAIISTVIFCLCGLAAGARAWLKQHEQPAKSTRQKGHP